MAKHTWLKQYYPQLASNCSKSQAIAHSLRKWLGLRKEHLLYHNIGTVHGNLEDRITGKRLLYIDSSSCALCKHFIGKIGENRCKKCPLYIVRGGVACDKYNDGLDDMVSPWKAWQNDADPEPMIKWLTEALIQQSFGKFKKKKSKGK